MSGPLDQRTATSGDALTGKTMMIHARADYNRIQDPAGLIPDDEPVFLIRAQDENAAEAVAIWANLAEGRGADPAIVKKARAHAALMRDWPKHKKPDLPA